MVPLPDVERIFELDFAPDLPRTLGPIGLGGGDPTTAARAGEVWRATRTPDGPTTVHLRAQGRSLFAEAWGPGSAWVVDRAPAWAGALDDLTGFDPSAHPVVSRAAHRLPGLRIPRTERVLEILLPTILAQKVTGHEAKQSWVRLVKLAGEPAPGPPGLLVPPEPAWVARLPDHVFHRIDVERKRAATMRAVCRAAARLEEALAGGIDVLRSRLLSIPGVGVWTAAEVTGVAAGDADAVSVGDYHLPNTVSWALAGEPRGDDARMLELLAPFAPHRGRVTRLLEGSGLGAPRRGPRMPLRPIAWH